MKLRTTTPASTSRKALGAKRAAIFVMAFLFLGAGIGIYFKAQPVSADQYDDKIAALTRDMKRYQKEVDRLNAEATTLANTLAQLNNEKKAIQAQITISQAKHDKLVAQIAETEKEIQENKDALGQTIADLYVDDEVSPIEMLASSQNIGEFMNKQEYRNTVQDSLSSTIKKVKDLKTQLDNQKAAVAKVLAQQKADRDVLVAKEAEQARLLADTQNDEAAYQSMIRSSAAQIAEAKATQALLRERSDATGGYSLVDSGLLSDYKWNARNCPMVGPLSSGGANGSGGDGRGYGCRQCASYVAWKIAKMTGKYYSWGNGGMFAGRAIAAGYENLGRSPQPGSVAVVYGNPGHVAWVEAVSEDRTKVLVSQYNYNYGAGWGMYSEMWMSVNFFDQYVKII